MRARKSTRSLPDHSTSGWSSHRTLHPPSRGAAASAGTSWAVAGIAPSSRKDATHAALQGPVREYTLTDVSGSQPPLRRFPRHRRDADRPAVEELGADLVERRLSIQEG